MSNHSEEFEKMKVQLHEKGYKEKVVTISSRKVMGLGVLYALPFLIIFGLLYRFLLIERDTPLFKKVVNKYKFK